MDPIADLQPLDGACRFPEGGEAPQRAQQVHCSQSAPDGRGAGPHGRSAGSVASSLPTLSVPAHCHLIRHLTVGGHWITSHPRRAHLDSTPADGAPGPPLATRRGAITAAAAVHWLKTASCPLIGWLGLAVTGRCHLLR